LNKKNGCVVEEEKEKEWDELKEQGIELYTACC
jgi:hypothetical protein